MSDREPEDENTPWTHQPYGSGANQPPPPPAYPTNPYADPERAAQEGQQGQQGQGTPPPYGQGQPQWGQPGYGTQGYPPPGQQPYGQQYGQQYGQPYGQPYAQQPGYQPFPSVPSHPQANAPLVWGIVALGGGFVCGLPLLVGPYAWFLGSRVRREIDEAGGQLGGRSEASAGMILGIIACVLLVLGVLAFVAIIAIAAGTSGY